MNEGVKLLMERIKTHPEEFVAQGRWTRLLTNYNEFIPDEIGPIKEEIRKLLADEFTKEVIKELFIEDKTDTMQELMEKQRLRLHQEYVKHQTTIGRLKYDSIEESS